VATVFVLNAVSGNKECGCDYFTAAFVFSTREKAEAYIAAHPHPYGGDLRDGIRMTPCGSWDIEEVELDPEPAGG
jgi:hypothetical protein